MVKKVKSSFINMFLSLLVVGLLSGFSLGYVYERTKEPIEKAKFEKKLKAIKQVLPKIDNNPMEKAVRIYDKALKDSIDLYPGFFNNKLVGVATTGFSYNGFNGLVKIIVGFDPKGEILDIAVLDQKETPGLGTKIQTRKFIEQFVGKNPGKINMKVKKDGGSIDAISGATITTRAFSESVVTAYQAYSKIKDSLKQN